MITNIIGWMLTQILGEPRTPADPEPHQHGPRHRFNTNGDTPLQLVADADHRIADRLDELHLRDQLDVLVDHTCLLTAICEDIRTILKERNPTE